MPVILIEKDPFVAAFDDLSGATRSDQHNVRRPLFGISPKPGTFSSLSVVTSDGQKVAMYNSSAPEVNGEGRGTYNTNFILQAVNFSRQERMQIQETFGDFYTFFFGESPSVAAISGILCNTEDFNWKNEFMRNYDEFLRGTKCVETRSRVYLGFDDVVLEGYVLNVSMPYQSEAPYLIPLSFSMLVTNYIDLSQSMAGYVRSAEDARTNSGGQHVEYLTSLESDKDMVSFDPEDGKWKPLTSSDGSFDTLQDESPSIIFSGQDNQEKLHLTPAEALVKIDVDAQVQQKGTDRTTALLARARDSAGNFPLSNRSEATTSIEASINQKVSFAAAVIKDQPTLP